MPRPSFTTDTAIEFSTTLLRAANVNEYFDVVAARLPRILNIDHYNFLIVNPSARTFLRHLSPNFPAEIFSNYTEEGASSDLVLKLAHSMAPGSFLHFADISELSGPTGWNALVQRLEAEIGFRDSLTLILHADHNRGWGAGLTLWRVRPSPVFSSSEVDIVAQVGPMLAAAFGNVWNKSMASTERATLAEMFVHAGNFTFTVGAGAAPVILGEYAADGLRAAFGGARNADGLPQRLRKLIGDLIGELEHGRDLSLISREVVAGGGMHRVYLTRARGTAGAGPVYQVVVMCNPDFTDLKLLLSEGYTPREVEALEHLQRGVSIAAIGLAMGVTERTVKFHLFKVGDKLGASGKIEILARAIALSRELAVRRGLSGGPPAEG